MMELVLTHIELQRVSNEHDVKKVEDMKTENENFDDDYVTKTIGACGLYQIITITPVSLMRLIAEWNALSMMITNPDTEFFCIEFMNNVTEVKNSTCYEDCLKYDYVRDVLDENIVTEFGLICDKAWLSSFMQTMVMFGLLCGVSMFGWISDRFGRSKAITLAGIFSVIFMLATPFSPTFWIVTFCRFCMGLGSGGIFAITMVYTSEMIGTRYREAGSGLTQLPDGLSLMILALFGYYATSWRWFMIEYTAVSVILVVAVSFVPETPRWLIANGKSEEAVKIVTQAAKMNKLSTEHIAEEVTKCIQSLKSEKETKTLTYIDLFRTKELTIITVSSVSVYFVTGLSYYGLHQYFSQIQSNLLIGVLILGVIHIPCIPVSMSAAKYFGRKLSLMTFFGITGLSMLALVFIREGSLASTFVGCLGMFCAINAFFVVYLFVLELYPTTVRNMGFSLCSAGSKLGAMVAPFVVSLKPRWISSSIFGVLPILAVLICLKLPETKGKNLKDTFSES